jgi:hypothetical protein
MGKGTGGGERLDQGAPAEDAVRRLLRKAAARTPARRPTPLTGAYGLAAQFSIAKGNALVPAGNALCALTSAAVQMSGSVSYTQF